MRTESGIASVVRRCHAAGVLEAAALAPKARDVSSFAGHLPDLRSQILQSKSNLFVQREVREKQDLEREVFVRNSRE